MKFIESVIKQSSGWMNTVGYSPIDQGIFRPNKLTYRRLKKEFVRNLSKAMRDGKTIYRWGDCANRTLGFVVHDGRNTTLHTIPLSLAKEYGLA